MRPSENIEKLIKKLEVEPRADASQRNIEDTLAAHKKAVNSAHPKPDIWGIIMKNNITKFAVAAMLAVAVLLIFNDGSVTTPAFGLNDVIEAMNKAQWTHCIMTIEEINGDVNKINQSVGDGWESWESSNPSLRIEKHSDGRIFFTETDISKTSIYYPKTNTITIKQTKQSASQETYSGSTSEILIKQIADLEKKGAKVIQREDTYLGKPVKFFDIDITPEGGPHNIVSIIVDSQTYFPKKLTWQQNNLKLGFEATMIGIFDCPQSGPKNIYEAGVPHDAKIVEIKMVDDEDNPDLIKVLEPYNKAREEFVSDYILITTHQYDSSIRDLEVIYNQGKKQRSEYRPVWGSVVNNDDLIAYKEALGDSFESLLKWSQGYENSIGKNLGIDIYDGQFLYSVSKGPTDKKWTIRKKQEYSSNPISLVDLCERAWPNIFPKNNVTLIENDFSREAGLLAFERITEPSVTNGKLTQPAKKVIYYLDPYHDYICVRKEQFKHSIRGYIDLKEANFDINETPEEISSYLSVSEFGQTDTGQWYPKKIESYSKNDNEQSLHLSTILTLYLKTNPEFPEGIFDPNSLPKEGD